LAPSNEKVLSPQISISQKTSLNLGKRSLSFGRMTPAGTENDAGKAGFSKKRSSEAVVKKEGSNDTNQSSRRRWSFSFLKITRTEKPTSPVKKFITANNYTASRPESPTPDSSRNLQSWDETSPTTKYPSTNSAFIQSSYPIPNSIAAKVSSGGVVSTTNESKLGSQPLKKRSSIDSKDGTWILGKTIGVGSSSKVKLAKNQATGQLVLVLGYCLKFPLILHLDCLEDYS
jgi:hypothetical protein